MDKPRSKKAWYLNETIDDGAKSVWLHVLEDALSFLILYNYIIPISLYVTMEVQKFFGSFLLERDLDLYDGMSNQPAVLNTSDLMEELGQVTYIIISVRNFEPAIKLFNAHENMTYSLT